MPRKPRQLPAQNTLPYCVQLFLYDGYSITRVDTPANK